MYGLNEAHYMDVKQPYGMVFTPINPPPGFLFVCFLAVV